MSIAGDLKLSGYPKETVTKYAVSDSNTTAPAHDTQQDIETNWQYTTKAAADEHISESTPHV